MTSPDRFSAFENPLNFCQKDLQAKTFQQEDSALTNPNPTHAGGSPTGLLVAAGVWERMMLPDFQPAMLLSSSCCCICSGCGLPQVLNAHSWPLPGSVEISQTRTSSCFPPGNSLWRSLWKCSAFLVRCRVLNCSRANKINKSSPCSQKHPQSFSPLPACWVCSSLSSTFYTRPIFFESNSIRFSIWLWTLS